MEEGKIIKDILSSYSTIEIIDQEEKDIIFFRLDGKEYGIWYSSKEDRISRPIILIKNAGYCDYPHIMYYEFPVDDEKNDKYRYICLYESNDCIQYLQSFEEKIIDAVDRLIKLVSLSELKVEKEYQKEFLYYWNEAATNKTKVEVYIGENREFKKINCYYCREEKVFRMVSREISLNDKDKKLNNKKKWEFISDVPAYYIPIIDNRRILPPTHNNEWTVNNVMEIIKGKKINRITHDTYEKISKEKIKNKQISFIFDMIVNGNNITYVCLIKFKTSRNDTLLNKLEKEVIRIQIVKSERVDYYYLNKQIGNDISIIGKKILLIGAGSLGSYVAMELVKSGFNNITIYDQDILEYSNIFRYTSCVFWNGINKAVVLKYNLERIHPEIHINAVSQNINTKILKEEMNKYDMIIFAVGSSDVQLASNKLFKDTHYEKTVIYSWLEAGGENSHVLLINYLLDGCFECLYTDKSGDLINNKVNKLIDEQVEVKTIRNGCGGTRVAYGTEVLLRTTSVILNSVKKIFNKDVKENLLIDINENSVVKTCNFIERKCRCCGDRDKE